MCCYTLISLSLMDGTYIPSVVISMDSYDKDHSSLMKNAWQRKLYCNTSSTRQSQLIGMTSQHQVTKSDPLASRQSTPLASLLLSVPQESNQNQTSWEHILTQLFQHHFFHTLAHLISFSQNQSPIHAPQGSKGQALLIEHLIKNSCFKEWPQETLSQDEFPTGCDNGNCFTEGGQRFLSVFFLIILFPTLINSFIHGDLRNKSKWKGHTYICNVPDN